MANSCNCGICGKLLDCPNNGQWESCDENEKIQEKKNDTDRNYVKMLIRKANRNMFEKYK